MQINFFYIKIDTMIMHRAWIPLLLAVALALALPAADVRYRDRSDGTVLDLDSGLVWMKCGFGQRYAGRLCRGPAVRMAWYDATKICADLDLAGREWRLPDRNELQSLIKVREVRPHLDIDVFGASYPFRYWSAGTLTDPKGTAGEVVNFLEATTYADFDGKNYVRCVSGGGGD